MYPTRVGICFVLCAFLVAGCSESPPGKEPVNTSTLSPTKSAGTNPAPKQADDEPQLSLSSSGSDALPSSSLTFTATASRKASVASSSTTGDERTRLVSGWYRKLEKGGWRAEAARAVVDLNADWWLLLSASHRDHANVQVIRLAKLRPSGAICKYLIDHPECAGLFVASRDHASLLQVLGGKDQSLISGLYVRNASSRDVNQLTEGLGNNREVVVRLLKRGLIGAEVVFVFDRKREAARVYERWLRNEFERRLAGSDEELASFYNLVLGQGDKIRDQLEEEGFRRDFPDSWRKLCRVVKGQGLALESFVDAPGIWTVLRRRDGEALLTQWGPVPAELLTGKNGYPTDLHPLIVDVLDNGDANAVEALLRFRTEPGFLTLLRRSIEGRTRIAALQKLLKANSDAPHELKVMGNKSDQGLKDYVGVPEEGLKSWVPLYSTYSTLTRAWDEEDVSTLEWVMALAEPASFALPGGKAASVALQRGGKKIVGKQVAKMLQQQAIQLAQKQLASKATQQALKTGSRQTLNWGTTQLLSNMQAGYRMLSRSAERLTTVDITNPVRYAYGRSHVGRETFKCLTTLDARLFMRKDARVHLHLMHVVDVNELDDGKLKALFAWFLGKTASGSEGTLVTGPRGRVPVPPRLKPVTGAESVCLGDDVQAWRKNVSSWWLLLACGQDEVLRVARGKLRP